ncbi:MAG: class I SAM-dependent methyltransferase [Bradymonadales bacterium]|nr:MAG: class I SAM-dependent methyltransferase [Bradymonadales bacterium]
MPRSELKYLLYEASVQEAADDAEILESLYRRLRKKKPQIFREDFCGTFKLSCEWVKRGPKHRALCLDIDSEPLAYGKKVHLQSLSAHARERIQVFRKNVMSLTQPKADLIAACNFSYWIFKDRQKLVQYFKKAYKSLASDGLFFLDSVGGTEMIEPHEDQENYRVKGMKFTYIWRCDEFNPVKNEGHYSISFKLPRTREWKKAFEYDWRAWTIPELRECLREAGFRDSCVFWEGDAKGGGGNGEFHITEKEENSAVWIAYVVGIK